ncbi:hypothetical protein HNO86_28935 [Pseudomonas sp. C1C7]|uniref:hypothetical protein n=1 Tax=Pseudomonas sp. C1C7 TaxID=2735272 RepID=UPI001586B38E|nr:hypothetical protein [Pseudomonas sp. C1C7]NUT79075.1 hypothetical protein [Pseudomonas sp. C1C7]
MPVSISGDAVLSARMLKNASQAIEGKSTLSCLLSFFSLIEASVLYERLWYLPFGDSDGKSVKDAAMWEFLNCAGVLNVSSNNQWSQGKPLRDEVETEWQEKVQTICRVPSYAHSSQQQVLKSAFYYAFNGAAFVDALFEQSRKNDLFFTPQRLNDWQRYASGSDFDQAKEDANDGNDGGRFTDWENMAKIMARAAMVSALEADYVGDAVESPIVLMSNSIAHKNVAARLYEFVAQKFEKDTSALVSDGYNRALAIPPIVALVLDRSDGNVTSIYQEILALREEFAAFRTRYREYQAVLKNPSNMSLDELNNLRKHHMQEVIAALNKISSKRIDSAIVAEIFGLEASGESKDGAYELDISPRLSIGELIKLAATQLHLSRIRGRASILFDTYKKATAIRGYHKLVQRRLGVNISEDELKNYKKYASIVEGISRVKRD